MMYSFSVSHPLRLFFYSFGAGYTFGTVRSWLMRIFPSEKAEGIADAFIIVLTALLMFCFYLLTDMGKIRFYNIVAFFEGLAVLYLKKAV